MNPPAAWLVAAANITGAGHSIVGEGCQDAHSWRVTARGDLIIVVCDGAGSSARGGDAARLVAAALSSAPSLEHSHADELSEDQWRELAEVLFRDARTQLETLAEQTNPRIALEEFACTVQLVVVTDSALYSAHVGDGRATARFCGSDEWLPLFVPDRGEVANETVFLSSPLPFDAQYWQGAAARLPGRANAVAVMTDGCEATAFECYVPDGAGGFHDPNRPFRGFFSPVANKLRSLAEVQTPQVDVDALWEAFIRGGMPRFAAESDDRTMVFGVRLA